MFEEELNSLLEKKWSEDELKMIKKLLENLTYYKKLIPKSLKQEIAVALQMCNSLKVELETFREQCKCNFNNKESSSKHSEELTTISQSLDQFEKSVENLETSVEELKENLNETFKKVSSK